MAAIKNTQNFTLRLEKNLGRRFGALMAIKGQSAQVYLREIVVNYVRENEYLLNVEEVEKLEKE